MRNCGGFVFLTGTCYLKTDDGTMTVSEDGSVTFYERISPPLPPTTPPPPPPTPPPLAPTSVPSPPTCNSGYTNHANTDHDGAGIETIHNIDSVSECCQACSARVTPRILYSNTCYSHDDTGLA